MEGAARGGGVSDGGEAEGAGSAEDMLLELRRLQATASSINENLQDAREHADVMVQLITASAEAVTDLADADKVRFHGQIETATQWAIGECSDTILEHFAPSSTDRPLANVKALLGPLLNVVGPRKSTPLLLPRELVHAIQLLLPPELVDSTVGTVKFVLSHLREVWDHSRQAGIDVACLNAELPDKRLVRLDTFNDNNWETRRRSFANGALAEVDICLEVMGKILEKLEQQPPEVQQFFASGE